MNTQFRYGTSSNLSNLSIVNGQIIALSDTSGIYYDLNGTRYPAYTLPRATSSIVGGVKLSDAYTSSAGTAAAGIAASSYAVYACYSTLNSLYNEVKTDAANGKQLLASTLSNYNVTVASDATYSEISTGIDNAIEMESDNGYSDGYNYGYSQGKSHYGTERQRSVMPSNYIPTKGYFAVFDLSANYYLEYADQNHFVTDVTFTYGGYTYNRSYAFDIEDLWANGDYMYFRESIAGVTIFDIYVYLTAIAIENYNATSISNLAFTEYGVDQFTQDYDYGTDDIGIKDAGANSSFDPELYV